MSRADDAQACIRSALRRRRRTLGLTQEDAARVLGMSRMTYHRIETGARRIRFFAALPLCIVDIRPAAPPTSGRERSPVAGMMCA
jgi:DNA-binding XRE family transcriptional regulator